MADVITRFKLETTQYDSKLRDEAKRLSEFTRQCAMAGSEFGRFSQKNVEAARALGSFAPSATNAKDKVKELVGAFNDAAKAYNALTKEQQQSDFGKAMAESIGQLNKKIREAKQELYGMGDAVNNVGGSGLFGGGKLDGMLQVFGGNLMTKAAGMAVGFASEIGDAVKQGIELAKAGEGVRIAFERLGRGDILDGLRQATHGTVTDLELMKAAVKFNDFKLPVEELGTMLAFAQQKAKDTGQSVDYMVDSIVTGLGRKSLMILDNLGLSANEVKEKMAETGDMTKAVGAIIREQMAKAGDYVETAADRAAQANVSLQNKMEELGRKFAPLEEASSSLWTSMKIGILDVVGGPLTDLLNKLTQAGRMANAYGLMGGNAKVGRMTANLAGASDKNRQNLYHQQQEKFWRYINPREQMIKDIRAWQSGERGDALSARVGDIRDKYGMLDATKIQAEVDAAKKMLSEYQQSAKQILSPVKANIDINGAEQNVDSLKLKLIELEAQRKKAIAAGDTDLSKNLAKQISQVKSDIKGLGGSITNKTTTKTIKTEEQLNNEEIQKLTQEYIYASEQRQAAIRDEIKTLQDRNAVIQQLKDEATGKKAVAPLELVDMPAIPSSVLTDQTDILEKWKNATIEIINPLQKMQDELKRLQEEQAKAWNPEQFAAYQTAIENVEGQIDQFKGIKNGAKDAANGFNEAATAINSVVDALNAMEDPSLRITGIIGQAIAQIALGFAQATAADSKYGLFAWIAAITGGMATMISTISAIHSATGYAQGGIVDGKSYSGDNVPIMANAGELVLTRSMQNNLAIQLQDNGNGRSYSPSYISGEQIYIALNRYMRRTGRSEIVTWK